MVNLQRFAACCIRFINIYAGLLYGPMRCVYINEKIESSYAF